ncbi:hypothetical protein [Paractinoplanes hotanensis]|uniref:Uncharacterized protein n=1 Tax=Paractinoplanes hotanensis TaxID=2906497 RepID=A0ABT0YA55_9ACTN|nr:hypothetical protein [Actinoplanes hotanensis]MCM4082932.1 hypothetical protein [Actinoplanes hotanensis]
MDQREWDYGARMSRERRAADQWSPRTSDSPDFADPEPKWSSLTDTGSLQPSAEALDWQRRADQWAQQAESDPHQSVEPANRWSDVAATGRTTFPADGVGWRTETAEWRAAGARWRQTTEWRSTTGSHVWRSTTEAWQTDGNNSYPAETETPMAQPAISSTAWSGDSGTDTRPAWQQFADSSTEPEAPGRSWSASAEPATPSRQQPSPRTPAESSPSWQQLVEPGQQPSWNSRPSWQRDAIEGSATWTDLTDQRSADSGATWLRSDDARDDGRHLVREDDRAAAWQRDAGAGSPSVGRRRAPEPGYAPSGGTGWSSGRSEAENGENTDNWARHTDTGGIQLYGDTPASPEPASWNTTGTGFGSRNVNRREEADRSRSPYGDAPGYEMPPATPYEPPPRQPRRDDTAAGYDATPRSRYAPEDEQPRYTDEPPTSRGRRSRRYADDADTPRRGDTGSFAPPEPRAARRSRSESDETATFSAVPMPAPPPTSAQRSAVPMPAPPPTSAQRSAVPMPAPPPTSAQRSAVPMPAPPSSAPRSAVPMSAPPSSAPRSAAPMSAAPTSAPRGGPSKGRARYNAGGSDWREQTGSWEAEPDTSSWVRDPDTGQWSRSDDDPRILAWRREAARREAAGEGPRALPPPPPPAAAEPEARPEPPTGWRNSPPPLPPGPTPRSAVPADPYDQPRGYGDADPAGYGTAPTSSVPGRSPYGYSGAPTSAEPARDPYGAAPTSPARDPYDEPRGYRAGPNPYDQPPGYGAAPTSSAPGRDPYGTTPTSSVPGRDPYGTAPTSSVPGRDPYGEPRGYGAAPGREPYDTARANGSAPAGSGPSRYGTEPYDAPRANGGATPGRNAYEQPRNYGAPTDREPYGSTPTSSIPSRDPYDQPRNYGTPPDREPYGSTPTSSIPGRDPYGTPRATGSAPTSSIPARDPYDEPRGYGSAPTSAVPARDPYDEPRSYGGPAPDREPRGYGSAPTSAVPVRDPYDEPRGYGSTAPSRDRYDDYGSTPTTSLSRRSYQDEPGNAPRSGSAYGGGGTAPYRGQPALPSAPRSAPGYGGSGNTPAGGVPGGPLGYSGSVPVSSPRGYSGAPALPPGSATAPASGVPQYIPREEPERTGRRRADDDVPTGRRGAVEPGAYAAEPLSPEAWQTGGRPAEAPPWSLDDPTSTGARSEPSQWQLEERRERARGSATYREGGGGNWRRDLSDQSDLADGESRRYGTSDYVPFRSGGSAAVSGRSNLSTTSTSLISPVGREAAAAPQRAAASWNGPSGAYERRPVTNGYPTGRKSDLLNPDDEEDEQESGSPLAAVGYTVIWYGVPVVLFVAYMLVVGTGAQGHALGTLAKAAPQFLISLVLSVLVAVGLRFVSHSWKAVSVGLAAAVVGGGLATVLTSAITGNSLS